MLSAGLLTWAAHRHCSGGAWNACGAVSRVPGAGGDSWGDRQTAAPLTRLILKEGAAGPEQSPVTTRQVWGLGRSKVKWRSQGKVKAQALLLTPPLLLRKLDSRVHSCVVLEQPLDGGKWTFKERKMLWKKVMEEGGYEDISRYQCIPCTQQRHLEPWEAWSHAP